MKYFGVKRRKEVGDREGTGVLGFQIVLGQCEADHRRPVSTT